MKQVITVLAMLAISGCSAYVDSWEFNAAEVSCKDHGGVDYYNTYNAFVTCADGQSESIRKSL